jgi:hypothetical protein
MVAMISRDLVKSEIDKLDAADVELLYKIIKAMHTPTEVMVRYPGDVSQPDPRSDAEALRSLAGMFNTGPNKTSEQVQAIVAGAVLNKHQEPGDDRPAG